MTYVDATFVLRDRRMQRRGAANPNALGNGKIRENVDSASLRHLTAEGKRAAQKRQQATQQVVQQHGALQLRTAQLQHESIRLRQEQQRHIASDAESRRTEQKERQEKYNREQQHQAAALQQKIQQLSVSAPTDPNVLNGVLARSIAAKQSGGAVSSIFNAGYGYEDAHDCRMGGGGQRPAHLVSNVSNVCSNICFG